MTTLETERLLIRPWQESDVPHYLTLSTDIGYNCFAPPGFFLVGSEAEALEKIKQRISSFTEQKIGRFLVFLKTTGDFIGTCGFTPYEIAGKSEVELGYRLLLAHWGRGYATEAARAVIAYAFHNLRKPQVFAFAIKQNPASLHVIKKLGFKYQSQILHADLDHNLFVMTEADFSSTMLPTPR